MMVYMMHTLVFGQVMRFTTTVAQSPIRSAYNYRANKMALFLLL